MRSMLMLFIALACFQVSLASPLDSRCGPTDHPDDCKALCDLWDATNGPNWGVGSGKGPNHDEDIWASGNPICDSWYGVMCYENGRVGDIVLDGNNLTGSIPESIGLLKALGSLSIRRNHLNGSIPESFGQLTNVTEIQLDGNDLTGSIPESIGQLKALKLLSLSANHLNGSIPESIGQLTGLT